MSTFDRLARYALVPMEASHLDEVLAIERMSYSNPWTADAFRHELEDNAFSRSRVALSSEDDGEVSGYCVFWIVFELVQIQNVAVHPRHRRRGLARLLLERALSEGEAAGARMAELEVRRGNVRAQRLYTTLGFEAAGERKRYYSRPEEDAVVFRRSLSKERS